MRPAVSSASSVLDDVDALLGETAPGGDVTGSAASDFSASSDGGDDPFAAYFSGSTGAGEELSQGDPFASFLPPLQPPQPQQQQRAQQPFAPPVQQQQPQHPSLQTTPPRASSSWLPPPAAVAAPPSLPSRFAHPVSGRAAEHPRAAVQAPPPPPSSSSSLSSSFPSSSSYSPAPQHYPVTTRYNPPPAASASSAAASSFRPTLSQAPLPAASQPAVRQPADLSQQPVSPQPAAHGKAQEAAGDAFFVPAASADSDPFASYFGDDDSGGLFPAQPQPPQRAGSQEPYGQQQQQQPSAPPPAPAATAATGSVGAWSSFPSYAVTGASVSSSQSQSQAFSSGPSSAPAAAADADGDSFSYFRNVELDSGDQLANAFLSYPAQRALDGRPDTAASSSSSSSYLTPPSSYHAQHQPEVMSAVELNTADMGPSLLSPVSSPAPPTDANGWLSLSSTDLNTFPRSPHQPAASHHSRPLPASSPMYSHGHAAAVDEQPAASSLLHATSSHRAYPLSSSPALHASPSSPRPPRASSVRSPHPIVSFGFGGRMLIMFPSISAQKQSQQQQQPSRSAQQLDEIELDASLTSPLPAPSSSSFAAGPGRIRMYSLASLLPSCPLSELSSLSAFPGPLTAGNSREKVREKLGRFVSDTVLRLQDEEGGGGWRSDSAAQSDAAHRQHYLLLMWKLLGTMIQHDAQQADRRQRTRDISLVLTDAAADSNAPPPWKPQTASSVSSLPSNTLTLQSGSSSASVSSQPQPGLHPLPSLAQFTASISSSSPSAASTVASSLALHEQRMHQQAVRVYLPSLLLQGAREEAVRLALQHELFADALLLSREEPALHAEVVRSLCGRLDESSLTRTRFLVQAGLEQQLWTQLQQAHPKLITPAQAADIELLFSSFPAAPLSLSASSPPPLFANWRSHAALCASEPSSAASAFLCHLGDCLWSLYSQPVAAHVCYLLSNTLPALLSSVPVASARVVLLAGDHRRNVRAFTSLTALQLTQVADFLLTATEAAAASASAVAVQVSVCHQQVYRLVYAVAVAELGLADQALRYCTEVAQAVKATQRREGKDGSSGGYAYSALFLHELAVLEHRLRVTLNAPASSPVRQKLVSGLFSVLDKGINMLVGEGPPATSNTGGAATTVAQSDWGQGGSKWEKPFALNQQSPAGAREAAQHGATAVAAARTQQSAADRQHGNGGGVESQQVPLSPAMYSAAAVASRQSAGLAAGGFSGFQLPSAALPRSSSSSSLSAQEQPAAGSVLQPPAPLRTSRSGDNLHSAAAFQAQSGSDGLEPSAHEQHPHPAPGFLPSPSAAAAAAAASSPHLQLPSSQHPGTAFASVSPHAGGHTAPAASAPSAFLSPPHSGLPPSGQGAAASTAAAAAVSNGVANGSSAAMAPGLLRRLGSVGGLFGLWGGAGSGAEAAAATASGGTEEPSGSVSGVSSGGRSSRQSRGGAREANLEQDHSFRWDDRQQRYVFVDKDGKELVEEPAPPPAAAAAAAKPAAPPPPLPPPRLSAGSSGMPAFAARGHTVTNRYALSVGDAFIAPQPLQQPAYAAHPAAATAHAAAAHADSNGGFAQHFSPPPPGAAPFAALPGVPAFDPASIIAAPMPDFQFR